MVMLKRLQETRVRAGRPEKEYLFKHGCKIINLAEDIGYKYTYVSNALNRHCKGSADMWDKIHKIIKVLESETGDKFQGGDE